MSYEGFEKVLCKEGHESIFDTLDLRHAHFDPIIRGCYCGAVFVWATSVDETNGIDEETGKCPGDVELEILEPAKMCHCMTCGMMHEIGEPRYKIPEGVGRRI